MRHLLPTSLGRRTVDPDTQRQAALNDLLDLAWKARQEGRPATLQAVYPTKTVAVSVTGKACSLNCSHCSGHYLEHMVDIKDLPDVIAKEKPASILVSGGCEVSGAVPLLSALREVKELARKQAALGNRFSINVHPGIAPASVAREIGETASVVSFDVVLDDETIKEAFHGMWTGQDYIETFRNLRKGKAVVVPHILIGLKKGQIAGEFRAVDFLLGEGIERLIFIVLIPTANTPWADVPPPSIEDVARVIAWTRARAPRLDISLGCMRPAGKYRREVDAMAVRCGVDRIVLPHPESLKVAASLGLSVVKKEECCAFE